MGAAEALEAAAGTGGVSETPEAILRGMLPGVMDREAEAILAVLAKLKQRETPARIVLATEDGPELEDPPEQVLRDMLAGCPSREAAAISGVLAELERLRAALGAKG